MKDKMELRLLGQLLALFALCGVVRGQWAQVPHTHETLLGGGCLTQTAGPMGFSGWGNEPVDYLFLPSVSWAPTGGIAFAGLQPITPTSGNSSGNWAEMMLVGFTDPNVLLPSCGCTVHASADIFFFAPSSTTQTNYAWLQYPAGASGIAIYCQPVRMPLTAQTVPFPAMSLGPAFSHGCTEEPSLAPVLGHATRIVLP